MHNANVRIITGLNCVVSTSFKFDQMYFTHCGSRAVGTVFGQEIKARFPSKAALVRGLKRTNGP